MESVSIIGVGRLGGALALALSRSGYRIAKLISRNNPIDEGILSQFPSGVGAATIHDRPVIDSDFVVISTGDPEIEAVADILGPLLTRPTIVFHTSGSFSSEILAQLRRHGYRVGSLHPLISVSDPISGSRRFQDGYFCVEGDEEAVAAGRSIVEAVGGRPFTIAADKKPLYHASGVTAAGHLIALIDISIEMLSKCGLDDHEAKEILLPLIRSTIENLAVQSPTEALTGSFARGDADAVRRHLEALDNCVSQNAKNVYLELGERSAELADRRGVDRDSLDSIRSLISIAKKNRGC